MDQKETRVRNYGIDLLRLISMLMIVVLHVLGQGGILKSTSALTLSSELFWSLEILCYGAVNIYAIISRYVGISSRHRYSSLISLCLQVTFYGITITAVEVVLDLIKGQALSFSDIFFHALPSIHHYWYFSAYFCLFFLMPVLNEIVNKLPRKTLKVVGIFAFIVFSCYTRHKDSVSHLGNGYSVWWLVILYVFGGYIAKYKPFEHWSTSKCFIGYFASCAITVLTRIGIGFSTRHIYDEIRNINMFVSYISPTIILSSVFLVQAFIKLPISKKLSKVIAFLTPMSFGVYLVHCHPFIFNEVLKRAFVWVVDAPIALGLLEALGAALAIFTVCMIVDWLRLLLFKVIKMKELSQIIEKALSRLFTKIFKLTQNDNN